MRPEEPPLPSEEPLEQVLARALSARTKEAVWAELEVLRPRLEEDREVALAWLHALCATRGREGALAEVEALLERWPHDAELVTVGCQALLAQAERPVDESPLEPAAASLAAGAAARCLASLSPEAHADPAQGGALHRVRANALRLLGPGRDRDAEAAFAQAIERDPADPAARFDRALFYKVRGRFEEALEEAAEAAEAARAAEAASGAAAGSARVARELRRGALFNLAIAATALGRAERAVEAYRALGIEARVEGRAAFVEGLAPVEVRLATRGPGHRVGQAVPDAALTFEVLWAQPLSPCHGVLRSPTFREGGADYGDVVLWDAAPVSVRRVEGRAVPRFPILAILEQGSERRLRFLAHEREAGALDGLREALPEGVVLYLHRRGAELTGVAHGATWSEQRLEGDAAEGLHVGKLLIPASVPLAEVAAAIEGASGAERGLAFSVIGLYAELGRSAEEGKQRKRWGALEAALATQGAATRGGAREAGAEAGPKVRPAPKEVLVAQSPASLFKKVLARRAEAEAEERGENGEGER